MDKQQLSRLMIGMAVAMLVVVGWSHLVQYLRQKNPNWDWGTPATQPAPQVAATQPAVTPTTTLVTTAPGQTAVLTTQPSLESPAVAAGLRVVPVQGASPSLLGSSSDSDPAFTMAVNINPRGAGLNSVVLNDFKRVVDKPDRYIFQEPYAGSGDDESRPLATRSITIGTETVDLRNVEWLAVTPPTTQPNGNTATSVTYRAVVARGASPLVQIDKTYTLTPRSNDSNSPQGYEVVVSHQVTNLTDQPLTAKLSMNGPMPPPVETDRMDDRQVVGGYSDAGFATINHSPLTSLTKEKPTLDFTTYEGRPLFWVGMTGVYFNAVIRPDQNQPIKVETVTAQGLNFDNAQFHHVILKLDTNAFALAPKGSATSTSNVFFGPRKRNLLQSDYYAAAQLRYDSTLVMTAGPCGFCTWQWLVTGLYKLLAFFHLILRDWGLAIICLVFIVRAILHPITKKSQINMSKMSKMGPEIERLKKKYGDNKDELNKAMMQFYKQQGATPILGCLPMFLQMPIWIALYSALQSTFELRQEPFLWGFTWIKDLAHPDRLFYFPDKAINLLGFIHIDAINVLPFILGVVSFMQAKIMQAQQPPSTTPEQETQKKMMVWMSLLLPVILYNGPSGLNLYIITSTTIGMIESHIVRKHIKEREALEKQGAVIIDGPPPDDDKPPTGSVRRKKPTPDKPASGGLAGWLTKLQQKAEDMQREAEKRNKKKK